MNEKLQTTLPPNIHTCAASAIGGGSILSVALMSHHPSVDAHDTSGFIAGVAHELPLNGFVHGGMIGMALVIAFGFYGFATILGPGMAWVRAGVVCYAVGTVAMIGAALTNGFVIPSFSARFVGESQEAIDAMSPSLILASEAGFTCARLGVVLTSSAFLAWSLALLPRRGLAAVTGAVGLLVGGASLVGLATGHLEMTVHGFSAFVVSQTVWSVLVSVVLLQRKL